ncbi:hypothetical protein [uncultured Microbacterium sp.]
MYDAIASHDVEAAAGLTRAHLRALKELLN